MGEFVAAAQKIEALRADVIEALGRTAANEGSPQSAADLVSEASRIIVETLTEIADVLHEAESRKAPDRPADATAAQEAVHAIAARQENPYLPKEPVSLNQEEMAAGLQAFFGGAKLGTVSVGRIAHTLGGGAKLETETYRTLLRVLNAHPNAAYVGSGQYAITPMTENQPEPEAQETTSTTQDMPGEDSDEGEEPIDIPEEGRAAVLADSTREDDVEGDGEDAETSDEELIGIMARWMGRRLYFSLRELRQHLLANEAVDPSEVSGNRIHALFVELMPYVEEYYFDRGDNVVWMDDRTNPQQLEALTGKRSGSGPVRYSLGFIRREDTEPAEPAEAEILTEQVAETVSDELVETKAEYERGISRQEIDVVLDVVRSAGGEISLNSLEEFSDEAGLAPEQITELVNAAMADGLLFRKGVAGYKGVSLQPKRRAAENTDTSAEMDESAVEREIEKYITAVRAVMASIMPLHPTAGYPYNKLWNKNKQELAKIMTFDEFKILCRRMRDDGMVEIPGEVKLHTKTPRSKKRIGSKVLVPDESRKKWRASNTAVIRELHDKALDRLIK